MARIYTNPPTLGHTGEYDGDVGERRAREKRTVRTRVKRRKKTRDGNDGERKQEGERRGDERRGGEKGEKEEGRLGVFTVCSRDGHTGTGVCMLGIRRRGHYKEL